MVKYFFLQLLACLLVFFATAGTSAYAEEEYTVKAAFIVNFPQFVEWPNQKAISKQSKIDVCVLGDSDIIHSSQLFKQASTPKLAITLVKVKNLESISSHCHMLFISSSEEDRLEEIFGVLKGQPVLTIGDFDNFAERGGMMGFVVSDSRIRFIVNKSAAGAAGLHVDSQLLEIALKVL